MRILVTNDDGIYSEGLRTLAEFLADKGYEVTVIAPDGNRSAFSHSLSIYKKLFFKEEKISDKFSAYSLSGTPADCVKFGVRYFEKTPFDLVCSGINLGNNLGSDTCYSGTVAAALEGNFFKIKSMAFSNVSSKNCDFKANARALESFFDKLLSAASEEYALNVNLPNRDPEGVKVAPLGIQEYSDEYERMEDGSFMLTGFPLPDRSDEDSDVTWASKNFVTVTPVEFDRTDKIALNKIKDLEF